MVSLIDVTGLKGALRILVQFDGLCCAGALVRLSRDANNSMKKTLGSVQFLRTLGDNEVDIHKPLSSAARHGFGAVVSALLAAGADKNAAMQDGATPLHVAAQNGHQAVVSTLVGAGADKNAAMISSGFTPLHYAAQFGYEAVVSALLAAGADE